jgi:hypothetical protein
MGRLLPWFGWALCFLPLACASSESPPGPWSGTPSSSAPTSAGTTAASGSSSGTPASGADAMSGSSSSSGGGATEFGNTGSSSGGAVPSGSSSGAPQSGSSGGVPLGSDGDSGTTTQSKTVPDIFSDAGPYSPPAEAGSGEHHPGESCMQSGCHDGMGGPDPFSIAGTVFKDYAGTIAYPGVEVVVQDATGRIRTTYSHLNGNFYMGGTLALPATVAARDGTTTRPMVTQLTTAGMGSCASAGCHVVGGSPSTGAYYPIHVP